MMKYNDHVEDDMLCNADESNHYDAMGIYDYLDSVYISSS